MMDFERWTEGVFTLCVAVVCACATAVVVHWAWEVITR